NVCGLGELAAVAGGDGDLRVYRCLGQHPLRRLGRDRGVDLARVVDRVLPGRRLAARRSQRLDSPAVAVASSDRSTVTLAQRGAERCEIAATWAVLGIQRQRHIGDVASPTIVVDQRLQL